MGSGKSRPAHADPYRRLLALLQTATGWQRATDEIVVDPAGQTEVRLHHPCVDGVLLVQIPDPIETTLARGVLYQPFAGAPCVRSRFQDALATRYQDIVATYETPGVRGLSVPPSVAVATVGVDRSEREQRRIATTLECIALDVENLHDRLRETVTDQPEYTV